jgi:hypothetical protein
MRLLLTNHHLESLGGSELLTFELAKECLKRGHQVTVFTFFRGEVAKRIEKQLGIRVFYPENSHELQSQDFDVVHCVHWPTYIFLQRLGIQLPTVFGFLGILPPLENPPPLSGDHCPYWWGVSEEVIENVAQLPGWGENKPSEPIRNWSLDGNPKAHDTQTRQKTLFGVVSNHFPKKYRDYLLELSIEMNFDVRFFGLPNNPQPINSETLLEHDAIITLGRTAISAICIGVPVLVLDQNGMDGWVTTDNYGLLREKNFSGRTKEFFPTKEELRAILSEKPDDGEIIKLRELAKDEHELEKRVSQILTLCERARGSNSLAIFPKSELVVLEYLDRSLHFESQLNNLLSERQALLSERLSLISDRDAILTSNSWKVTEPARRVTRALRKLLTHKA